MGMARKRLNRAVAAALMLAAAGACSEPVEYFGPAPPSILNPSLYTLGPTSFSPSGYLGVYAEPRDPSQRFESFHRVPVDVISPTGDSITIELGPRFCEVAPRQYSVCQEYVLILDTTVATSVVRGHLRDAGFVINMLGGNQFAVAFDILRRPHSADDIARVPYVHSAGNNSIGWLDTPPTDLDGKGLHGAVELTRGPSLPTDHVLSVPDTGAVMVRYRQPNGALLTRRISITPQS